MDRRTSLPTKHAIQTTNTTGKRTTGNIGLYNRLAPRRKHLGHTQPYSSSKREEIVTKMSAREPIQQIGHNPFMTHHTYIEDVAVRDNFLKPINTTQGSLKDSSK